MKNLETACFLLGITTTPEEVKYLTAEEKMTLFRLVEREYGINIFSASKKQLLNVSRKLNNTRYWNHLYEGGC